VLLNTRPCRGGDRNDERLFGAFWRIFNFSKKSRHLLFVLRAERWSGRFACAIAANCKYYLLDSKAIALSKSNASALGIKLGNALDFAQGAFEFHEMLNESVRRFSHFEPELCPRALEVVSNRARVVFAALKTDRAEHR
jgi:hypothetical protein